MSRPLPFDCPRGLNRLEAARYIGVSPTTFDKLVTDGRMPRPKEVGARRVYDRAQLDSAFDALGEFDVDFTVANEWDG
jgi:excisionase family DNA binding protein